MRDRRQMLTAQLSCQGACRQKATFAGQAAIADFAPDQNRADLEV